MKIVSSPKKSWAGRTERGQLTAICSWLASFSFGGEMVELYFKLKIIFSFAAIAVIAAGVIVAIVRNKR